jgi:hypothetical protein
VSGLAKRFGAWVWRLIFGKARLERSEAVEKAFDSMVADRKANSVDQMRMDLLGLHVDLTNTAAELAKLASMPPSEAPPDEESPEPYIPQDPNE